jgi:DNA-binding Lrp family transcriptional regulator
MTLNSKFKDLSPLDIEILKKLSEDDRISHRQLGRDLDKRSPVTIKKHVEELEESGVIKNYNINLDYEKLGYDIIAIIEVTISKGKMFDVEKRIAQNPNVFGVYDITGTYDALILARFRTREDLSNMIKEELHASPNVEHTNTHIVLNIIKEGNSFTDLIEKEKGKETK